MYEEFYGLREKPFSILPDPDLIYWGPNHRLAFAMLEFGVLNSAGFTVITGDIGSGKTTLIRHLLRKLDAVVKVGLVSNTPHGRDELLQWIMMSLDLPFSETYPAMLQRFNHFLHEQNAKGRRTLLIFDEAQNLEADLLEELRMFSNINAEKQQFLQLILVGQPQLKQLLRTPKLLQFAQRVSSDFNLRPLSLEEVGRYIAFRLQAVGGPDLPFHSRCLHADRRSKRRRPSHHQHSVRYRVGLRLRREHAPNFRRPGGDDHRGQANLWVMP